MNDEPRDQVDDPLADVFPGTADAPLPVIANRRELRGGLHDRPRLLPHPADRRWGPA